LKRFGCIAGCIAMLTTACPPGHPLRSEAKTRSAPLFIPAGFLIVLGLAFVVFAQADKTRGEESAGWPTTRGEVLESKVVRSSGQPSSEPGGPGWRYCAVVRYKYRVDGRDFESERVHGATVWRSDDSEAKDTVGRYPKGGGVDVHYDPARPSVAVLETGSTPGMGLFMPLGIAVVGVGLVFLWMAT
jgi:hypothetical protein